MTKRLGLADKLDPLFQLTAGIVLWAMAAGVGLLRHARASRLASATATALAQRSRDMWKAAALLAWFPGLGVGLPCVYAIWYFADHGVVWTFMGFPTYGGGAFDDAGIDTSVPLLVALLGVCLAELVLGWLLWGRRRGATSLALALLPIELAFWIGFDLPLGPIVGVLRTGLVVVAAWTSHRAVA